MNYNTIISSPIITAAIISGTFAMITIVVQSIIALSKNKKEDKLYYEKTLLDKLEKIYTPLFAAIFNRKPDMTLIDEDSKKRISQYGYLLTKDMFGNLQELIVIEEQHDKLQATELEEYIFLKEKVLSSFRTEFSNLHESFNKSFNSLNFKYSLPLKDKIALGVLRGMLYSTVTFWLTILIFTIGKSLKTGTIITGNTFIDSMIIIWTILSLLSTFLGCLIIIGLLIENSLCEKGNLNDFSLLLNMHLIRYYSNAPHVELTCRFQKIDRFQYAL